MINISGKIIVLMFSDVGKVWVGTTNEILGVVPGRPISANPGLKFCSVFILSFPCIA